MKKYKISEKSILIIEDKAIDKMMKYCQKPGMKESGGILLGKVKSDFSQIEITDVSEPSCYDKRGRFYFVRNKEKAQKIIDRSWEKSNGIINYIGEWHTHPEPFPIPSIIDKRLLNKCIKENYYTFCCLFLIIIGSTGILYVGYKSTNMNKI